MTGYVISMSDQEKPHERAHAPARGETSADEAHDVQTVVVEERGRWAVDIIVVFADGVVRKRIDTHATRARAELAADLIRRAANRDIGGGPLRG